MFQIFYPDLIDKSKAPTYTIVSIEYIRISSIYAFVKQTNVVGYHFKNTI